ncbi:MAG TPA: winged helix-turn-helix domain-containing protein [Candidatus Baltobacteraceae bacterium]|nr:winged helix-turn-helix domain-containing protein [Candidatus Baltobacteraceae bacterium]
MKSTGEGTVFSFSSMWLDPVRRILLTSDGEVILSENVFRLLILFLESGGEVVSKRAIAERVWPDHRVSKANLHQHVFMLRQLLGEGGREHSFLVTIPRIGYRFVPRPAVLPRSAMPGARRHLLNRQAETPSAALTHYSNGCADLDQSTPDGLRSAAESFRSAIEADASYARAHIALARAYAALGIASHISAESACAHARSNAARAAALGINAAELAAAEAEIAFFFDWDFVRGRERLFDAVSGGGTSIAIRSDLIRYLVCSGDIESALSEVRATVEQFPQVSTFRVQLGNVLMRNGDYAEAAEVFQALDLRHPNHHLACRHLAACFLAMDKPALAFSTLTGRAREITERDVPLLVRIYCETGAVYEASALYKNVWNSRSSRYVSNYDLALMEAALGRSEQALESLSAAFRERDPRVLLMRGKDTALWFAAVGGTTAYANLLERLPLDPDLVTTRSA